MQPDLFTPPSVPCPTSEAAADAIRETAGALVEGGQINRLTLVRYEKNRGWHCRCDCGNLCVVERYMLVRGLTKSCGCLRKEMLSRGIVPGGNQKTHGCRYTRTYKSWQSMKERCLLANHKSYQQYGGRGITVSERWLHSFENFLMDMGHVPDGCSLDRIDNEGSYEPGNCRWASAEQQQRNKSNNRLVTAFGETKPAIEWLEDRRCVVNRSTLYKRLQLGWEDEDAIARPKARG